MRHRTKTQNPLGLSSVVSTRKLYFIMLLICCLVSHLDRTEARPKRNDSFPNEVFEPEPYSRHSRTPSVSKERTQKPKSGRHSNLRLKSTPEAEQVFPAMSNQVLECEAGGNPPPTIHWLKDGKRISQRKEEALEVTDNGILGLSFTRSRLFLDCTQPRDAGRYNCVAENPFKRISAVTDVEVVQSSLRSLDKPDIEGDNSVALCLSKKSYGSPAQITMWTHTRLELIGSEAQLYCRATGSPQPVISWIGPEDMPVVSGDKYMLLKKGDLLIRDLAWSDMGSYTCVAENEHGADRSLAFLYPTLPEK